MALSLGSMALAGLEARRLTHEARSAANIAASEASDQAQRAEQAEQIA